MRTMCWGRRLGHRVRLVAVLLLLIISGVSARPHVAQADPHAMFYTAIGQRQLFFNMLAALDQADYVEPATGEASRQQLAQKRDAAGFRPVDESGQPASDKVTVTETKTNLPSLLTRSITLEGYDMWTAYLERQFALESKRRRDVDEILRVICTINTGHENCSSTGTEPKVSDTSETNNFKLDPSQARVQDPRQEAAAASIAGRLAFASDIRPQSDFQKYLRSVLLKSLTKVYTLPVPIDLPIALLRQALDERDSDDPFTQEVNDLFSSQMDLAVAPTSGTVDPSFFDGFSVNEETGDIEIDVTDDAGANALPGGTIESVNTGNKLDKFTAKLGGLASNWLQGRAELATSQVTAFQARDAGDFHPTTLTVPKVKPPECKDTDGDGQADSCDPPELPSGPIIGINTQIKTPASNKLALAEAAANALVSAAQDQATANATEESVVGETELVYRPPADDGTTGSVQGIQDNATREGRVLHTVDEAASREDLVTKLSSGSDTVNPATGEQGPAHVLSVMFGKARGSNEGCGCSLHGSASQHSSSILAALGQGS